MKLQTKAVSNVSTAKRQVPETKTAATKAAPRIKKEKPSPRLEADVSSEERMQQFLQVVTDTAFGKGWTWTIHALDEKTHRYASVGVTRGDVDADIDISFEGNDVRYPIHAVDSRTSGLADLGTSIAAAICALPWIQKKSPGHVCAPSIEDLIAILNRFAVVARQLRKRHNARSTIKITDEYDVQDVLHALLRSRFDDVRPEESVPSYAGGNSRIDFLLTKEKVAVEAKMTRPSLKDRQIGEELVVDIARYAAHPGCETLVCFVYDPNGYLTNPRGLESDLSGLKGRLNVRVVVSQ